MLLIILKLLQHSTPYHNVCILNHTHVISFPPANILWGQLNQLFEFNLQLPDMLLDHDGKNLTSWCAVITKHETRRLHRHITAPRTEKTSRLSWTQRHWRYCKLARQYFAKTTDPARIVAQQYFWARARVDINSYTERDIFWTQHQGWVRGTMDLLAPDSMWTR